MKQEQINIIRDAAISLERLNLESSLKLMKICYSYRPKGALINKKIKEYTELLNKNNAAIRSIDNERFEYIEKNIELLRNKTFQIHEAMSYLDLLKVKEIDDPAAKLSPIEIIDKGSSKTLIVFGGMALQPSMPPKEFFKSFVNKDLNLIFLKDFQQCWYQKGLLGKSHDINSTIEYIISVLPHNSKEIITLGTSSGGYAAIRFGVQLKATKIIAFSPQSKIAESVFKRFKSIDSRLIDIELDNEDLDLKAYLSKNEFNNIDIYYGEENEDDRTAVKYIQQYVNSYSFATKSHSIASYLKKLGKLEKILSQI